MCPMINSWERGFGGCLTGLFKKSAIPPATADWSEGLKHTIVIRIITIC